MITAAIADRGTARVEHPSQKVQLRFLSRTRGFGTAVAARELLNAARRVYKLLFASKKRMARRTDANFNVLLGRARMINSAAGTDDIGLEILWMNVRLHDWIKARNLGAPRQTR